jgi:hypothetical protein
VLPALQRCFDVRLLLLLNVLAINTGKRRSNEPNRMQTLDPVVVRSVARWSGP